MLLILQLLLLPLALVAQDAVVIDYMVLYTPAAEQWAGGAELMQKRIERGVAAVNSALARSDLAYISFRLVHTQVLAGNNISTDLNSVQSELAQLVDTTALRDQYRADAVSFIVERLTPGAYASIPLSASQARLSLSYFGVANYGGNTTAHELGHNLGGRHSNPEPEDSENLPYWEGRPPYGYTFVGQDGIHYKTLMSDDSISPHDPDGKIQLTECGCYSNPQATFQGSGTGKDGYANMAASIAYWAPRVALTYSDSGGSSGSGGSGGGGSSGSGGNAGGGGSKAAATLKAKVPRKGKRFYKLVVRCQAGHAMEILAKTRRGAVSSQTAFICAATGRLALKVARKAGSRFQVVDLDESYQSDWVKPRRRRSIK